jgi:predicted hotdog family 3-hydroxylacyl-ACP dehydratase
MRLPAIATLVPHAAPMLLLDRVVAVDAETLCAEVTIRPDSLFYGTHGVGAWVGIEYMAQAIAAYAGYHAQQRGEPVKIGFLLGARRYECNCAWFAAGDRLLVEVQQLLQAENGLGSFSCTIRESSTQQQLAQATVSVFQPHDAKAFLESET